MNLDGCSLVSTYSNIVITEALFSQQPQFLWGEGPCNIKQLYKYGIEIVSTVKPPKTVQWHMPLYFVP